MRYLLLAFFVFSLIGCDKPGSPVYDPPMNMGTGAVLIFSAINFEARLNEHLSIHPEYRVVSIHEFGGESKWVVIVETIPNIQPPINSGEIKPPTTAPYLDPNK